MICLWVQMRDSCDPRGLSDGSRLAVCQLFVLSNALLCLFLACALCYSFLFVVFCLFVFAVMLSLD